MQETLEGMIGYEALAPPTFGWLGAVMNYGFIDVGGGVLMKLWCQH